MDISSLISTQNLFYITCFFCCWAVVNEILGNIPEQYVKANSTLALFVHLSKTLFNILLRISPVKDNPTIRSVEAAIEAVDAARDPEVKKGDPILKTSDPNSLR